MNMIEPCPGCGRMVLVGKIANLVVKCDPTPLTDVGDIVRLLTSPNPPSLWMVERNQQGQPSGLRGARPGEPGPVREHRCTRVSGDGPLPRVLGDPMPPKGRETGVQPSRAEPSEAQRFLADLSTPFSAAPTAPSSARYAGTRLTDAGEGPVCDGCSRPMADGTYASIEVGDLVVWAQHVERCPTSDVGS